VLGATVLFLDNGHGATALRTRSARKRPHLGGAFTARLDTDPL